MKNNHNRIPPDKHNKHINNRLHNSQPITSHTNNNNDTNTNKQSTLLSMGFTRSLQPPAGTNNNHIHDTTINHIQSPAPQTHTDDDDDDILMSDTNDGLPTKGNTPPPTIIRNKIKQSYADIAKTPPRNNTRQPRRTIQSTSTTSITPNHNTINTSTNTANMNNHNDTQRDQYDHNNRNNNSNNKQPSKPINHPHNNDNNTNADFNNEYTNNHNHHTINNNKTGNQNINMNHLTNKPTYPPHFHTSNDKDKDNECCAGTNNLNPKHTTT